MKRRRNPRSARVVRALGLSMLLSMLVAVSPAGAQNVGPGADDTTVPSTVPTTETTAPTTVSPPESTVAPTTTAPTESTTSTTAVPPPTSEAPPPEPAVEETVPRRREPAPTTRPTFVPPAGNPDAVPEAPDATRLDEPGTRYLPLLVLLSLGGFALAAAIVATQWYRTRPGTRTPASGRP